MEYGYLLSLALILLSTKIFGLVTKRVKLPQVVGALMAGLILGPACLGVLKETEFITQVSEIGVIVLMFCAGLETDIKELKKTGASSFIIALLGVIVPLLGGWGIASIFNKDSVDGLASPMLQNIFIGIILTATSVSITVETLKEMGRLSSKSGNAILGAAVIDDILGIIALTVITSSADKSVNIGMVLLKILLFFIFAIVVAIAFNFVFNKWSGRSKKDLRRYVIIGFVFCLLMSFSAEHFFGVADITGAFVAGLALSNGPRATYLSNRFDTLSYMLLSPVFFASIGLKVVLPKMSASIILFAVILLIVAVITKVIGCGLGAKICKFSNKDSLRIGVGMVSRGEVALIVASKGAAVGLMNEKYFAPIVIMVVVTTIITPILLKFVYKSKKGDDNESKGELEVGKFTKSSALEEHEQNLINQKS
ncbi:MULTISPECIES: cation:proton antiporter [Porcipelethomonas]|jgi:Kef-type K+ transport system membrane component KefB|uniref:cation:proton antiporter n=1 Tax=Porcipelethomonas TaxID=2981643 RepID=UPI000820D8C2|nr:cation:proton antiporter [Porcipelethomonas ammoniilytica]MBS6315547.1 cation:proton antiporter [Ruminococcus sp.]MCU6720145.1 cation:proton antiporter [Porcipelethomonas ammoniilytica]OLA70899.1 MAG: sodium:proton antiporter [Ruminococcus sp. 37_24]SCJ03224.1 Inner membrane protein ybaL [uncultured Ruminococcus sp.]